MIANANNKISLLLPLMRERLEREMEDKKKMENEKKPNIFKFFWKNRNFFKFPKNLITKFITKLIIFGILCYIYQNGFFESCPAVNQLVSIIIETFNTITKLILWILTFWTRFPIAVQIMDFISSIPLP